MDSVSTAAAQDVQGSSQSFRESCIDLAFQRPIEVKVQKLAEMGIISEGYSPWNFPVVVVAKKGFKEVAQSGDDEIVCRLSGIEQGDGNSCIPSTSPSGHLRFAW